MKLIKILKHTLLNTTIYTSELDSLVEDIIQGNIEGTTIKLRTKGTCEITLVDRRISLYVENSWVYCVDNEYRVDYSMYRPSLKSIYKLLKYVDELRDTKFISELVNDNRITHSKP